MVEEITRYEFVYTPWNREFPIKACTIVIYAKDRKEAELIALKYNHEFFNQDCTCTVHSIANGYRKVKDE